MGTLFKLVKDYNLIWLWKIIKIEYQKAMQEASKNLNAWQKPKKLISNWKSALDAMPIIIFDLNYCPLLGKYSKELIGRN